MTNCNGTSTPPGTELNWSPEPDLPVVVTVPDSASLLSQVEERLTRGDGFSIATLNLDHAVKLSRDPAFRRAYAAQTHVTADGNPVVWLLRLSGQRDIHLVTGSDAVRPVVALAARLGAPVGLFGSVESSLAAAAEQLCADYPGLLIPFRMAPPMGFDPEGAAAEQAIDAIRQSGARLVLLALGAPKQEIFAARAQRDLPDVGFMSIGAGIDFISGTQQRAPAWTRRARIEWLWRMAQNPRRLIGRYAACFAALPRLTISAMAHRIRRKQHGEG
jgi:exopolysaccharide biosynthesis WecB/TagA/CpsF family protein